jgi:diguanylate cyclase (GGDEF)-like protein
VGDELVDRLRAALSNPRASGADPLALRLADGSAYEATWHRVDGHLVVELEPAAAPALVATSTLFEDVRHAMDALQAAEGVQGLCDAAATELKCLTGYDRVMVYRFDPDEHGEVVAEEREPELEPFLGLHYPASDIPRQARKLYLLNPLRVIVDVDYEPIVLLRGPESAGRAPLNLGFAGLRSVSPFHLAYLRNMGVGATLTISLMRGPRLWGMLACHHRTPKRLGAQMRAACRLLAQVFSLQVAAWEARERHAYRTSLAEIEAQLVARMSGADDLADALASGSPAPIELTAADGMVARIDGRTVTAGAVPAAPAVEALLARLRARNDASVFVCDDLAHRFGELGPFLAVASGVLAVALSADLEDFILWFRRERIHTVTWGGNPHKPMTGDPLARPGEPGFAQLGPRTSFRAWAQEVRGQSHPWQEAEIDAARALAAAVPELLLARARDRLAHSALHDGLTGLPNRALLSDRIAQALSRPHRRGRRVALLFVDLDRFKVVNDSLGHAAGDVLLRQAADRLSAATRDADTVARLGGDEFVVLCEDIDPARAEQIAQRIVDAFRAPFVLDGHGTVVTASVGVAIADAHATAAQLLRDADTAMYRVKHGGRNAAAPFTRSLRAISLRRVEIETGLRPALENGDLRLHFQPIHTVQGALTGLEALVRWPLPGRGMVPPTEFVAVAEETGLIAPLTAWALDDGLAALARWRRRRPELDLTLSINISPTQMTPALHGVVGDALARHALPPAALCLEITERALVADDDGSRRLLGDLRDQGVRLSIDDFGTGYSSLAYLSRLPVHEIKIDRAFIGGLGARPSDTTVVASIVALAHQLGLQALAEGVETPEQLATIRRLRCDLAQGFLLARPMPARRIDRFLTRAPALHAA